MIRRAFDAIGDRLQSAGYFFGDTWASIPPHWRLRGAVALGAVVLLALAAFVVVPNLPCAAPGGDDCGPADDSLALVPADSLGYVHVNIEAETEQAEAAVRVAERTPLLSSQVIGLIEPFLLGGAGRPPSFSKEIEPWFGGEITIALIPGSSGTQQVQMLEVADEAGARRYEASIGAGAPEPEEYKGTQLREDRRGVASAVVANFLVIGSANGVRSVIDVSAGAEGAKSLADDPTAEEAFAELPADSFAQAYLSTEGIDSFLALSDGALAPLDPLVDSGESLGAAFALGADEEGYRFATRSVLDPERAAEAGGFFSAFEPFRPLLPAEIAPDTLAYIGFGNTDETVSTLLEQATLRAPGIAREVSGLVDRLRKDAGVDLTEELLPALNGEGAFAVTPRPEAGGGGGEEITDDDVPDALQSPIGPETIQGSASEVPYFQFVADDVDEEAAAEALAGLQKELIKALDPAVADPAFRQETIGDVTAQVLQRSPATILAYAIAGEKLVVADDLAPIERLDSDPDDGLAGAEAYESATDGLAEDPSVIAYLDLSGLVAVAERLGAGAEGPFATFADDLGSLQTLAITVGTEEDVLASDAKLRIEAP